MGMGIQPLETHYNGYYFRSRLEARWAIYFDAIGLRYEYEPDGYEVATGVWYLPDFLFPDLNCFGEVKHGEFSRDEFDKCMGLPWPCLLLDGMPEHRGYYAVGTGALDDDTYQAYLSGDDWGRVMIAQSQGKGRLWFLFGESADSYRRQTSAIEAARSARFEHGKKQKRVRRHRYDLRGLI